MRRTRGDYRVRPRRCATTLGVLLAASVTTLPSFGGTPTTGSGAKGLPVVLALRTAVKKLDRPECRLLYTDFRDPRGRTLQEGLTERNESGRDHLLRIVFEDGDRMPVCRRGGVLAYTSPGSGTVYLCTQHFMQAARDDVEVAAAIVIHEQLHALGLLENPPTSAEITERVLRRCGR
ncbi:MAG: hypothetical protein ABI768_01790 [Acidobacteriota bacterium]